MITIAMRDAQQPTDKHLVGVVLARRVFRDTCLGDDRDFDLLRGSGENPVAAHLAIVVERGMVIARTEEDWSTVDFTDLSQTGSEAISEGFGLSYASYLVLPRAILERMPNDWQLRFMALIGELQSKFSWDDQYAVFKRGEDGKFERDPLSNYRHPSFEVLKAIRVSDEQGGSAG
jgi:hypothetical protein